MHYLRFWFFIILWVFLTFPQVQARDSGAKNLPKKAHQAVYEAQKALDNKQYEKARRFLLEYINKHPHQPHALVYYFLGNAWHLDGHPNEAYEAYKKGYSLDSRVFSLCLNLAKTSYTLKKYHEAGTSFEKAYLLAEKPEDELLYQAGVAYFEAEEYEKAISVVKRLLDKGTGMRQPWLKLMIHACLKLEQWQEAEQVLATLLEQNRTEVDYWELLAQIRLKLNDHSGAASALEIAYGIKPPEKDQWEKLANLYFHLNIPLQAVRCLEKAYGPNPSPEEYDRLAKGYIQAHRMDQAIHYLNQAIEQEPSASRYLEKGKLYYAQGQWEKAAETLQMCLRLEPDNGAAHILLGFCAWELGNIPLAQEAFARAAKEKLYQNQALKALATLQALADDE